MTKKVSIIIPVYNAEKYLEICLSSVAAQTIFSDSEVICVNDGSSDGSAGILRDFQERFANIRVIEQDNQGSGAARNRGLDEAEGEFIAFMDSDDRYPSDGCLERLFEAAESSGAVICGGSLLEDYGSYTKFRWTGRSERNTFLEEGRVLYRDYQWDFFYQRFLFRRNFLNENALRFPPYLRFQDVPFFVRAMIAAEWFYAVPDYTYYYRHASKAVDWNKTRTSHLLMGVTDVLEMSSDAGLERLHRLLAERLVTDCRDAVMKNASDMDVLKLLEKADGAIRREWIEDERLSAGLFRYVKILNDRKNDLSKQVAAGKSEIEKLKKQLAAEKKKNEDLKNSLSYRIGRKMTAPGRAVRDRAKRNGD